MLLALRGWVGEDLRRDWIYSDNHPSTIENQTLNSDKKTPNRYKKEMLEPIKDWTIMKGDRVCLHRKKYRNVYLLYIIRLSGYKIPFIM